MEGRTVTGRRGRRSKQLLDDLKKKIIYWKLRRRRTRLHLVQN